jgi:uncharacterized protein DUF4012
VKRLRWVLLVAAALVLAWAGWAAATVLGTRNHLESGRAAIERARASSALSGIAAGKPLPDLRRARSSFSKAMDRLDNPLLSPARLLPIVGRQVRSATALSKAAVRIVGVAERGIVRGQRILRLPRRTGRQRLTLLLDLEDLARDSRRGIAGIDLGPSRGLIGSLARARDTVQTRLAELNRTLSTAEAATRGLGALLAGPRRYIVFGANNSEMRAGSGMWLTLADLRTSRGTFSLGRLRHSFTVPIPPGVVRARGDMGKLWRFAEVGNDWTSLMMSPRLELSGPLAARMWAAAKLGRVDGVLVIDPVALREIVEATGPVTSGGLKIPGNQIEYELLFRQYLRFTDPSLAPRREALGAFAGAAFDAINRGNWNLADLAAGLARAARGRHVMLWSSRADEQRVWTLAGVDGALEPNSLMVNMLNRGGNKLDRFLKVSASLAVSPSSDTTNAVLTIRLRNVAPLGLPPYVAGPHPDLVRRYGLKYGDYFGIPAVSLPGAAGDLRVSGLPRVGVYGTDGPTFVVAGQFIIPRGRERTIVVRFRVLGRHASVLIEPSARVPGVTWTFRGKVWADNERFVANW